MNFDNLELKMQQNYSIKSLKSSCRLAVSFQSNPNLSEYPWVDKINKFLGGLLIVMNWLSYALCTSNNESNKVKQLSEENQLTSCNVLLIMTF